MASQKCPCPNPKTCEYVQLHGKRDFADVVKLRIERERLSWIFWVGLLLSQRSL